MWKFKTSKFKNAAPKIPKKEEWISEVSAAALLNSCGNHIEASAVYMAFNMDTGGGGNIGVLPLETRGRQVVGSIPVIRAHAEYVTDFAFSPFDDFCLASASQDATVKIWQLPASNEIDLSAVSPTVTLAAGDKRVETVCWHPTVAGVITATAATKIIVYNTESQQEISTLDCHDDQIQSCCWRGDGSVMATSSKDKKLRILDPRAQSPCVMDCPGHSNVKDSRVIWLGNKDLILSSGFDMIRNREVALRDCRNLSRPVCTNSFDTSTSVLMPLYDADTGMLFLAGQGDTCLQYLEVTEDNLVQDSVDAVEQIKGLCLVPKRAMDVMSCEVDRLLLLAKHSIVPIPYHVPRKSLVNFHRDLYPDTACGFMALTLDDWLTGQNQQVCTMSLDPQDQPDLLRHGSHIVKPQAGCMQGEGQQTDNNQHQTKPLVTPKSSSTVPASKQGCPPVVVARETSPPTVDPEPPKPSVIMRQKKNIFSGVRQSKFRHLEGVPLHKSNNIENIRNLSKTMPGESDMFQTNIKFCALPLGGSGGLVSILKLNEPGRLPDTGIPALQNSSMIDDFVWNPFDDHMLAVACDDATIRLWKIPEEGLTDTLTEADVCLHGHTQKIYLVRYHPLASDVLASASYDMTIRIWNLETNTELIQLQGHTETIFCLSWSPDGRLCATVCKDGLIRIYDPRNSTQPIRTGSVPAGTHGARVVWACNSNLLLVIGFEQMSERSIRVYKPEDLSTLLAKIELDMSPAILVPHYDHDSSTLFLTGKGESTVKTFEVAEEEPHLFPLSDYKAESLHQAIAFLPKSECDVTKIQFARALRLTTTSVEPLAFTVPRIKKEYFQDDLFPDTKVTWEPALTASEWFSGANKEPKMINLQPKDMNLLSSAPVEAPKPKKYESFNPKEYKTDDQKKEELLSAMMNKFEVNDGPLPQDLTEGVDEDEWDDY